ncbi:MAG: cyclophilin-like fold protein [Lachnospiraceae bacterium]|nr:cyclophilin-like fold protein [Lachnospiraceae bacterium]
MASATNVDAAGKISLSQTKLTLTEGSQKKLTLKNKKKNQTVTWSSTKKKVASVDKSGKVTAKKAGTAVIKAKIKGDTYSCKITVKKKEKTTKIKIRINKKNYSAQIYNTKAGKAFLKMLPLTLTMSELNGNEKYHYMDKNLPENEKSIDKINTGDLMLYGNDCLVLFYKTFSTSYDYTKLGFIENPSGLAAAVGKGSVKITFTR